MDVRIREKVGALRGVIQRIQPYAHHHEFFIAVPDEKLQELLDWRAMLLGVERHIKHEAAVPFSTGSSPSEPWPRKVSPSRSDAAARERAGGLPFDQWPHKPLHCNRVMISSQAPELPKFALRN